MLTEYISTFPTGFGGTVRELLEKDLPGSRVLDLYDGLIRYRWEGAFQKLRGQVYLNNTFRVLSFFQGADLSFPRMVQASCRERHRFPIDTGTYRVRFSRENQFAKVEKETARDAERHVEQCSRLRPDRVSPQTEIWYLIRSEGVGFYCQLLFRREATEKRLHPGELRPEFACLLCACAGLPKGAAVCDPFCGYGAIPKQLLKAASPSRVLASDVDKERIAALRKAPWAQDERLSLFPADALDLKEIPDRSVDGAVTDPPWGYYEQIGDVTAFYTGMLSELGRVVKPGGRIAILTAGKRELADAAASLGIPVEKRIDTLVNGKKAAVFLLKNEKLRKEEELSC